MQCDEGKLKSLEKKIVHEFFSRRDYSNTINTNY